MNEPMQLSTRIVEAAVKLEEGMGRKISDGIRNLSMAVTGVVIGFIKGWDLALILLALMPFLSMKVLTKDTQTGIEAYGQAGAIAQESLSNVRTVHTFNACRHFIDKYASALDVATRAGSAKGWQLDRAPDSCSSLCSARMRLACSTARTRSPTTSLMVTSALAPGVTTEDALLWYLQQS